MEVGALEERILGTECEYALFHQVSPHSPLDGRATSKLRGAALFEDLKEMSALLVSVLKSGDWPTAGQFLGNGGRFYIDRGSHPEYATPECRSVMDLVAHEKAGDRLVRELVKGARMLMARNQVPGELHVFKNNLDTHGNTYGSHENYLIAPQAMERIERIIPFLLTRQIFAGAGKIAGAVSPAASGTEDAPFRLSQRADFIDRVFSDRTSETRGIINTRKREIVRQGQNVRLHIILGDSNLSEHALGLKVGTTALALRLLEEDGLEGIPMFLKPVEALKSISRSLGSAHEMEGSSARYTALDVQSMYLERAQQFLATRAAHPEEKGFLDLWERALVGLKDLRISCRTGAIEDDPGNLSSKLDWVLKLWILNRTSDRKGLAWSDPQMKHLDFKYHDLDPDRGLFERCASLKVVDRVVTEERICLALRDPPQDTRAWMRGMIIQNTANTNVEAIVENWESIKLVPKERNPRQAHPFDRHWRLIKGLRADLKDPFESRNQALLDRVSRFVEMWDAR